MLNTEGYFSSLLAFFDKAVEEGFVSRDSRKIVVCAAEPAELLDKLEVTGKKDLQFADLFAESSIHEHLIVLAIHLHFHTSLQMLRNLYSFDILCATDLSASGQSLQLKEGSVVLTDKCSEC